MTRVYTILTLLGFASFLLSYSANPPNGYTGAPGDGFCNECHGPAPDTLRGTISVEGFPASITPGEIYRLTVVNRNTQGNAKKGGFQMTILGPFNTRAGSLANPSDHSAIATSAGRQYFEHNPSVEYPDSNVIRWSVDWTAPMLSAGSKITWFASGNIANGNQETTGDRIVASQGQGEVILAAAEVLHIQPFALYPNPGQEEIYLDWKDNEDHAGKACFYDIRGMKVTEVKFMDGKIEVPDLSAGIYWVQIIQGEEIHYARWVKQ